MKKWFLISVMIFSLSSFAAAEVLMMHDGNIYLGKIVKTDSSGIVIESFGQTLTISQSDILRSEKNFDSFKDVTADIKLRDGSLIKGKIQNFDDEIGIYVDIDFGTITLPVASIKEISNGEQKIKNNGYNYLAGLILGYYQPIGGDGKFSSSYLTTAFIEKNTPFIRGLYTGAGFSYLDLNHENTNLDYSMFILEPYFSYKFLSFRNSGITDRIIPFARIGFGLSYITLEDGRPSAGVKSSSELNPVISAGAGFDLVIANDIMMRISMNYKVVPQSSEIFQAASLNLGAVYGF